MINLMYFNYTTLRSAANENASGHSKNLENFFDGVLGKLKRKPLIDFLVKQQILLTIFWLQERLQHVPIKNK